MSRFVASILALAATALLGAGCITVHTFGDGRRSLEETLVYGKTGPRVLLLDIDDIINDSDVRGPLGVGGKEATTSRVREQLDKAEKTQVAGVLLRINSPGGAVTASDVVYREILRFKQKNDIPIVTIMMGMAASGGYYVAMASDYVIAHPTTVTGSIGVIAAGLNLSGLMQRYGVGNQTITAGEFKDAGSPLRPMTAPERAYLQAIVDDMHARFREVVVEGRPELDAERVRVLADGRIYTAGQALENGLVDELGYMPDAIDELKRRIQAPEIRVVAFHREREWRANLYSSTAPPPAKAGLAERLGIDRGPGFLYLWWPGGLAP
ncbi:MAG: signal peptide peptidase SppA [Deltaproteobacteria bacterium]|nr:signal peptide peptidase SppA [Deltaproteobacteria bacterium]